MPPERTTTLTTLAQDVPSRPSLGYWSSADFASLVLSPGTDAIAIAAVARAAPTERDQAEVPAVSDDLTVLREEFPGHWIWLEEDPGRSRYVARRRHQGLNPHTVATPDIRELRDALQPEQVRQTTGRTPVSPGPSEPASRLIPQSSDDEQWRGLVDTSSEREPGRHCGTGCHTARFVVRSPALLAQPGAFSRNRRLPVTPAGQALRALRGELGARGVRADAMVLARRHGQLSTACGPAVGYAAGWFWWRAGRVGRGGRPVYAIHDAGDPTGAVRRLQRAAVMQDRTQHHVNPDSARRVHQ